MVYINTYTGKQAVTQILKLYYVTVNDFFVALVLSWGKSSSHFRSYLITNLNDTPFITAY